MKVFIGFLKTICDVLKVGPAARPPEPSRVPYRGTSRVPFYGARDCEHPRRRWQSPCRSDPGSENPVA